MFSLGRTIFALGLASFFTDVSSEMIYPLLPIFLAKTLSATTFELGLIEGLAESFSAFFKYFSGRWTDSKQKRKPLIVSGYFISGVIRPLVGIASGWSTVLSIRLIDRTGKGIRTSPRDALIADSVEPGTRGLAYGFQQGMDDLGAVCGPLVASLLIWLGFSIRNTFLLAIIPSLATLIVLIYGIKEPENKQKIEKNVWIGGWSILDKDFKLLLFAVFIFTLGNSTDFFILLKLSNSGVHVVWIATLWAAHNAIRVVSSLIGGKFSDRFGSQRMIQFGWFYYAFAYLGFALVSTPIAAILIFIAYAAFYGMVEPAQRAWVADYLPVRSRGTGFGFFHLIVGLGALPASILFGIVWQKFDAKTAFLMGAFLATIASVLLLFVKPPTHKLASNSI